MGGRKGEWTKTAIDRDWPFQVALPAPEVTKRFQEIEAFSKDLPSLCVRRHAFLKDDVHYLVYCFWNPDEAQRFLERFDGQHIDPKTRPPWPGRSTRNRSMAR